LNMLSRSFICTASPLIPMIHRFSLLMVSKRSWFFHSYFHSFFLCLINQLPLLYPQCPIFCFQVVLLYEHSFHLSFLFGFLSFLFPVFQFDSFQNFYIFIDRGKDSILIVDRKKI
jgi:hypothetical protein